MVTKEQERKALEKITEIIDGLGENSYIGMAMTQAIEIARENINCDFGGSLLEHLEFMAKEKASDEIEKLKAEKKDAYEQLRLAEESNLKLSNESREFQYQNSELVRENANLKDQITELKAQLWDFHVMTKQ